MEDQNELLRMELIRGFKGGIRNGGVAVSWSEELEKELGMEKLSLLQLETMIIMIARNIENHVDSGEDIDEMIRNIKAQLAARLNELDLDFAEDELLES